jgi:hypothetical protein
MVVVLPAPLRISRVSEDQIFDRKLTPSATATLLLLKNAR